VVVKQDVSTSVDRTLVSVIMATRGEMELVKVLEFTTKLVGYRHSYFL